MHITLEQVLPVVQDLVAINSENPGSDEFGVSKYVQTFMESLNIPVALVPVSENRVNVVARLKGTGESAPVAFTGHMDVVPVSEAEKARWHTPPFEPTIIDGRLYGRGAADMKGGLGAAMAAMRAVKESGVTPPGDILLIATVDEEDLMRGSKALIKTDCLRMFTTSSSVNRRT